MAYTYEDIFEGDEVITFTRAQVLNELDKHGVIGEGINEFFQACGDKAHYNAQDVLIHLGY